MQTIVQYGDTKVEKKTYKMRKAGRIRWQRGVKEEKRMERYWLSICIPTYNRGKLVKNTVAEILDVNLPGVQVVVVDNASTDESLLYLQEIKNDNFKLVKNKENMGGVYNGVKALLEGDGQWLLLLLDKDSINLKYLEQLKIYLEMYQLGTGYVKINYEGDFKIDVLKKGVEGLQKVAYLSTHPTGFFYKCEYLQKVCKLEYFGNTDNVGAFPFEFLCAEICCMDKSGIVYLSMVRNTIKDEIKSVSYSEKKNKKIFFDPESRFDMMVKCIEHLNTLPLSRQDKKVVRRHLYQIYWQHAVTGYADLKNNPYICAHYFTEQKCLTYEERKEIARNFKEKTLNYIHAKYREDANWFKRYYVYRRIRLKIKCVIKGL